MSFISRVPDELVEEAAAVKEQTRSYEVRNSDFEKLDSSMALPALKEKADALPDSDPGFRPHHIHDAALYRSARYSVVGGVFCHVAGLRGHYRNLYEAYRLASSLKQPD